MLLPAQSLPRRLGCVALVIGIALVLAGTVSTTPAAAASGGCSAQTKSTRIVSLVAFKTGMKASRASFFRTHRKAQARRAFVRAQAKQLAALQKAVRRCSASGGVPEGLDPVPAPCSPSLYSLPNQEMNEGTENARLPLRPATEISSVMLFVDFSDLHATESTTALYDHLVPRPRQWYRDVSYGRARLDVAPVNRWFRMPNSFASYNLRDGISWPEHRDYIRDAVRAADADVDFSRYKVVFVVAARGTRVDRSPAFQAYEGSSGIEADGTELRFGSTFFEDTRSDWRYAQNVVIHELGHIVGLPDLYDIGADSRNYWSLFRFAGGWDTMSWNDPGGHFLAWEKWKIGWLDSSQLTCLDGPGQLTTTITPLERAGGLKAVVVPTGDSSAFVVEARRRIGQDARLCEDGVLAYWVYGTVRSGSGPVRVVAAQRDTNRDLLDRCGPLYNATFDHARNEVDHFEDASAGISLQVLSSGTKGYRVKVTRASLIPQSIPISATPPGEGGEELAPPVQPPYFVPSFLAGLGWGLTA